MLKPALPVHWDVQLFCMHVVTLIAHVPYGQGRSLRGGVCMLLVLWEQAGRRLSADEAALLSSGLHSTFLHLKEPHSKNIITFCLCNTNQAVISIHVCQTIHVVQIEICHMVQHLKLNVTKTKELVLDYKFKYGRCLKWLKCGCFTLIFTQLNSTSLFVSTFVSSFGES